MKQTSHTKKNSNAINSSKSHISNGGSSKTKRKTTIHKVDNSNEPGIEKEITITKDISTKTSKFIPKYKIVNKPAFSLLEIDLKPGQSVIASTNAMAYMDAHIKMKVETTSGFFSAVKRALFTSSSLFLSRYTGTLPTMNKIGFSAPHLPEDIVPIILKPGENIMVTPSTLLCYTDNLEIYTKRRLRGIFVGEGGFQTNMINNTDEDGVVWLSSYGGYYKLDVKAGNSVKIDNGLFLCAPTHVKYAISKVGSLFASYVSGEGLVMHFEGPATIYCQGRSLNKFIGFIKKHSDSDRGRY
jgi:uncharacterized protein (TIGR00266 family)